MSLIKLFKGFLVHSCVFLSVGNFVCTFTLGDCFIFLVELLVSLLVIFPSIILLFQSNRSLNTPPPPPGHLTPLPAQVGGHLNTTQGVGNLIASLDIILQVVLIPHGLINHGVDGGDKLDEFKGKDCVLVVDWLKTRGLHKLCSVFEGV